MQFARLYYSKMQTMLFALQSEVEHCMCTQVWTLPMLHSAVQAMKQIKGLHVKCNCHPTNK